MSTTIKRLGVVMVVFVASAVAASQADAAGRCGRTLFRGTSSSPAAVASTEDGTVRRSFSYEPSYRSSQSYSAPKKAPWQYPKTDPRRYRP